MQRLQMREQRLLLSQAGSFAPPLLLARSRQRPVPPHVVIMLLCHLLCPLRLLLALPALINALALIDALTDLQQQHLR
jgi:hypothetical protein